MEAPLHCSWLDPEPRTSVEQFLCRAVDAFQREAIPFWLCGGYALEAHLGRPLRAHKDVDFLARAADSLRLGTALAAPDCIIDDSDPALLVVYQAGRCVADIVRVAEHPAGFLFLRTPPGIFPLPPESLTRGPVATMWGRHVPVVTLECLYAQKAQRRPAEAAGPADARREADLALIRSLLPPERIEEIHCYCGLLSE
jgi:hypothetical protein